MRRWNRGARRAAFIATVAAVSAGCLAGAARPPTTFTPPDCLSVLDEPLPGTPQDATPLALDTAAGQALDGLARTAACQAVVCPGGACSGRGPEAARAALDARHGALRGRIAELRQQLEAALQAREVEAQTAARARELEARRRREELRRLEAELRLGITKGTGLDDGPIPPPRHTNPPPPPPPPPAPERVEVTRFPTIEAKSKVQPGEAFGVTVSLAAERFDEETQIVQGQRGTPAGSLMLLTPLAPDAAGWKVRVQLSVTGGMEILGPNTGELVLPRVGDSSFASFEVRAGPGPAEGFVYATFFEGHAYLGRARRPIRVEAPAVAAAPAATRAPTALAPASAAPAAPRGASLQADAPPRPPPLVVGGAAASPPDLSITIHVGFDHNNPHLAQLHFDSPWITVPPTVWDVPDDLAAALARDYATFANRSARGLVRPGAGAEPSARELLLGFGRRQWQAVPLTLQVALERLLKERGAAFTTVQIVTNEPTFPWELVALPDGQLLGTRLAVARWHLAVTGGVRMRPPQRLRIDGVSMLAPAYQGSRRLPAQEAEVEAVRGAARGRGQVRVWMEEEAAGRSWLRERLQDDGRAGAYALHFAGHGEVDPGGAGAYRLDLGQDGLTSTEWREVAAGGRAPPFLFLNACNLGQVDRVAGLADGWAPASLEAGVAGYVGGLWPIGDRAAAEAARVFYEAALAGVQVAEALRRTRARFLEAGDPTFLAYVYYGDPRLAFEVAAPARP